MNKGYLLLDYLISLFVMIMILALLISSLKIYQFKIINYDIQDEIMLYKLRKKLLFASNIELDDNVLSYEYLDQKVEIYYVNGHLINTPGTIIILENIDDFNFEYENSNYYINYCRNNHFERRKIYD